MKAATSRAVNQALKADRMRVISLIQNRAAKLRREVAAIDVGTLDDYVGSERLTRALTELDALIVEVAE